MDQSLSHRTAPARELAQLHAARWEHELYFRDAKRVLRQTDALQSRTVVTAAQEIAGIVLATALLARERARAAAGQVPALRIKFGVVLAIVQSQWFFLGPCEDPLTDRQKDRRAAPPGAHAPLRHRQAALPHQSRRRASARQKVAPAHGDALGQGPLQFTII